MYYKDNGIPAYLLRAPAPAKAAERHTPTPAAVPVVKAPAPKPPHDENDFPAAVAAANSAIVRAAKQLGAGHV